MILLNGNLQRPLLDKIYLHLSLIKSFRLFGKYLAYYIRIKDGLFACIFMFVCLFFVSFVLNVKPDLLLIVTVQYVRKQYGGSGVYLLDENGYIYSCYRKYQERNYWRCSDSNNQCLARISLRAGREPIFTRSHNHASNYDPRTMTILSDDPP